MLKMPTYKGILNYKDFAVISRVAIQSMERKLVL